LQAKLQEKMQLESDKYLEEVRKAEALQKTMGCIGKIVGALVAIASIAAGALTGNVMLIAFGVIGAGLMIADELVKEFTGVSFMAEAMKPLITGIQEAISFFTDLYTTVLVAVGVDPETAKDIAQIAGMIAGIGTTIAVIALAAILGVQVIGPMIGAVASKLATVVSQAAPAAVEAMKQMTTSAANTVTQMLTQLRSFITNGADPVALARYATNVEIARTLTEFGGVVLESGLGIESSMHQAQAAEHLTDVTVRMAISESIASYLTQVVEDYGKAMQDRTRHIEHVFSDLQRSHSVSLQMARYI
jgi:invasin B